MALNKNHWENIYTQKQPNEVSWTQDIPQISLDFINSFNLHKKAKIIDIGGGDSKLVDFLLSEGYSDITVLDISEQALNRAKQRLGKKAQLVKWIVSDITEFRPNTTYDLWHDRATFHFLTTQKEIEIYLSIAEKAVNNYLTIGTFSTNGPLKCSGLDIVQYNEETLSKTMGKEFVKIKCLTENHTTPFNTLQNFIFCSFKKA